MAPAPSGLARRATEPLLVLSFQVIGDTRTSTPRLYAHTSRVSTNESWFAGSTVRAMAGLARTLFATWPNRDVRRSIRFTQAHA